MRKKKKNEKYLLFLPFPKGKYVCSRCGSESVIPSCDSIYEKNKGVKLQDFSKCLDCNNQDLIPMTKEEYINIKRTKLIDKIL